MIVSTYERSFETWLLEGRDEATFAESSYVKGTLPDLLRRMTAPSTA